MTQSVVRIILFASIAVGVAALIKRDRPFFPMAQDAIAREEVDPRPADHDARAVRGEGKYVARPGAHLVLGTEVAGEIVALPVSENQTVRKGDLIAQIDSRRQRAQLAQARARIAEARADIDYLSRETERVEKLFTSNAASREMLDRARRDLAESTARRDQAVADADYYRTMVEKTRVVAPIDGVVVKRFVEPGQIVSAGDRIVTIADPSRARVEAEVDEFDAGRIAIGSPVLITAEGYPGRSWRGRVEQIPADVVARELKPQDPASPTDVGVLMVKIDVLERVPLKLDQRVEVEIQSADKNDETSVRAVSNSASRPSQLLAVPQMASPKQPGQ